jgi:hypothetical protein
MFIHIKWNERPSEKVFDAHSEGRTIGVILLLITAAQEGIISLQHLPTMHSDLTARLSMVLCIVRACVTCLSRD